MAAHNKELAILQVVIQPIMTSGSPSDQEDWAHDPQQLHISLFVDDERHQEDESSRCAATTPRILKVKCHSACCDVCSVFRRDPEGFDLPAARPANITPPHVL
jgi:hypothetical protein